MKQYIDKSAVIAEIERRIASLESIGSENYLHDNYPEQYAMLVTLKSLKFSLDTLEVKEVEEPSKDLEEAAKFYTATHTEFFDSECKPHVAPAFIAGAKWQEEQIMKDAIEREVKEDAGGYPYIDATELYDYENDRPLAKAGDKIKVLIVKE